MTTAKRIRARRAALGMTQQQLADACGIDPSTVSKWEKGVQLPPSNVLPALCDALGVTADYLLGRTDDPAAPPLPHKLQELAAWAAPYNDAAAVPDGAAVSTLAPAGSAVFLSPVEPHGAAAETATEEQGCGRNGTGRPDAPQLPLPVAVLNDAGKLDALGWLDRDPAGQLRFRRPPAPWEAVPRGRIYRIDAVAVLRRLQPDGAASPGAPQPHLTQAGGTAQSEATPGAAAHDAIEQVYQDTELVYALARATGIPEEQLAALVEAVRAEGRPLPDAPDVFPRGALMRWGVDMRDSAVWNGVLDLHVRPLARLTAVPAEVLAALLLVLARIYADRRPDDLITQADAARLMGTSRQYIQRLVSRDVLRAWDVDGTPMVRMRDVVLLASGRRTDDAGESGLAADD